MKILRYAVYVTSTSAPPFLFEFSSNAPECNSSSNTLSNVKVLHVRIEFGFLHQTVPNNNYNNWYSSSSLKTVYVCLKMIIIPPNNSHCGSSISRSFFGVYYSGQHFLLPFKRMQIFSFCNREQHEHAHFQIQANCVSTKWNHHHHNERKIIAKLVHTDSYSRSFLYITVAATAVANGSIDFSLQQVKLRRCAHIPCQGSFVSCCSVYTNT